MNAGYPYLTFATLHTVSAGANPEGSGTVAGTGDYPQGTRAALEAGPEDGYAFVNWTEGGTEVSTDKTYTFKVTADCSLTANFSQKTYTVTATAGDGGRINPASRTVAHGETTTFTVAPDTGYAMAEVIGCNGTLSGTTYTTGPVTQNCTVEATFSLNDYTVTVASNPSEGGSVSGGGAYVYGQEVTVEASANTGYSFVNWTEDGTAVSTESDYTFTVISDWDLVANFALTGSLQVFIDPPVAAEAGAQWRRVGITNWYNSGDVETDVPVGTHEIEFRPAPGWMPEGTVNVQVQANATSTITGSFVEQDLALPGVIMLLLDDE